MSLNQEEIDLWSPVTRDVVLEVRTSKMKQMRGLQVESGIDKKLRSGSVWVSRLGLEEDEHDLTFHGGRDKAVHQYCSSHYPGWRAEYPEAAELFCPGGFGENLVTRHMNERNVCVGDVWAVGDRVRLQVSLPRQPCYKLNHRFMLKNFAPQTWRSSRTGWYYRVLEEGEIRAGDDMLLVERRWPRWTIERVQEFLHRNPDDGAINEELASVEALGSESRGAFQKRVAKAQARARREKGAAGEDKGEQWRDFRIVEKRKETDRVAAFVLEALQPNPEPEPLPQGGLHARLELPNGLRRTYSVVSGDGDRFQLGVALEPESRGGSRWLHELAPDSRPVVKVGRITSDVHVAKAASHHVFVAGGIGITAFLSLMHSYHSINYSLELHYAVRSAEDVPFKEHLDKLGANVRYYDKSRGERMDVDEIIRSLKWNSQLYVCGPSRMMTAAREAVTKHGVDNGEVHFEAFEADTSGDPFEAEVANRGSKLLKVEEDETLLEVLRREFGSNEVDSSCEVGNCGTCKIRVKSGRVEHRGTGLAAGEKDGAMLSCVSRGMGRIAVEI